MDNCIFCKIARGEIPSRKVFEDDEFFVFHDIKPAAPVHLLIIPKIHVASLSDVADEHAPMLGRMLRLAPKLAAENGAAGGFKVLFNTGRDGGQEVWHLHMHVMGGPRPWSGTR